MCRSRKKKNVFRGLPDGKRSVPTGFSTVLSLTADTQIMNSNSLRFASLLVAILLSAVPVAAQSVDEMQQKAIQFLEVTQAADGSWTSPDAVGITGLVTTSLLMSGKTTEHPLVRKGLDFIVASQQPTGGIHAAASRHQNYETNTEQKILCRRD